MTSQHNHSQTNKQTTTMAFITIAPLTFKSTSTAAACGTSVNYVRPNTFASRRSTFAGATVVNAPLPSHAAAWSVTQMAITQGEVESAQAKWANGVVKIGSLKDNKAECESFTDQFLNERYAFDMGNVLFKPTKCAAVQFRPTKPEALSYFIAGDKKQYAEDSGFAVTPWTNVRFENTDFILEDGRAVAMGNYYFTDTSGGDTKVEYTFGYKKVNGELKIDLHHSSLPFPSPN